MRDLENESMIVIFVLMCMGGTAMIMQMPMWYRLVAFHRIRAHIEELITQSLAAKAAALLPARLPLQLHTHDEASHHDSEELPDAFELTHTRVCVCARAHTHTTHTHTHTHTHDFKHDEPSQHESSELPDVPGFCVPLRVATHCNTLPLTHCNALQRTATHCNTPPVSSKLPDASNFYVPLRVSIDSPLPPPSLSSSTAAAARGDKSGVGEGLNSQFMGPFQQGEGGGMVGGESFGSDVGSASVALAESNSISRHDGGGGGSGVSGEGDRGKIDGGDGVGNEVNESRGGRRFGSDAGRASATLPQSQSICGHSSACGGMSGDGGRGSGDGSGGGGDEVNESQGTGVESCNLRINNGDFRGSRDRDVGRGDQVNESQGAGVERKDLFAEYLSFSRSADAADGGRGNVASHGAGDGIDADCSGANSVTEGGERAGSVLALSSASGGMQRGESDAFAEYLAFFAQRGFSLVPQHAAVHAPTELEVSETTVGAAKTAVLSAAKSKNDSAARFVCVYIYIYIYMYRYRYRYVNIDIQTYI